MILNGPKLLVAPAESWERACGGGRTGWWLLAAALTASVWPATAVVAGHVGSALVGHQTYDMAAQRAAVGLLAAVGGAAVIAPAFALALIWLARTSRATAPPDLVAPSAMGVVWAAWAAGIVLAIPPLAGLGPEVGEAAWALLAVAAAVRALWRGAIPALGVRRRWARHFLARTAIAFTLLFAAVPIAPAFALRALLGVEGRGEIPTLDVPEWPVPPEPSW